MDTSAHRLSNLALALTLALTGAIAFAVITATPVAGQAAEQPTAVATPRVVDFVPGFNGFTYTGDQAVAPEALLGDLDKPNALLAIFKFDDGSFQSWRPGPAFLNNLDRVEPLDALFLQFDAAATWLGPAAPFPAGELTLERGFNLVPALMIDRGTPQDLLGTASVDAVFLLNPDSQLYDSHRPGGLALLNTLELVPRFEAIWVLAPEQTTLAYPAFAGAPSIVRVDAPIVGPDGLISVTVHGSWGPGAYLRAGGVDAVGRVFCGGGAMQSTFDPALPGNGSLDLDLHSDGAVARLRIEVGEASSDGLAASIAAAQQLIRDCVEDETEAAALLAPLEAAAANVEADDVEAALGDLDAYLGQLAETESIDASEREAYQGIGESLVQSVGALIPSLFDAIGDILGGLIFVGIFP